MKAKTGTKKKRETRGKRKRQPTDFVAVEMRRHENKTRNTEWKQTTNEDATQRFSRVKTNDFIYSFFFFISAVPLRECDDLSFGKLVVRVDRHLSLNHIIVNILPVPMEVAKVIRHRVRSTAIRPKVHRKVHTKDVTRIMLKVQPFTRRQLQQPV